MKLKKKKKINWNQLTFQEEVHPPKIKKFKFPKLLKFKIFLMLEDSHNQLPLKLGDPHLFNKGEILSLKEKIQEDTHSYKLNKLYQTRHIWILKMNFNTKKLECIQ